jgi:hypothetical protein
VSPALLTDKLFVPVPDEAAQPLDTNVVPALRKFSMNICAEPKKLKDNKFRVIITFFIAMRFGFCNYPFV